MRSVPVHRVTIYHLAIGLRRRVDHFAAQRSISEPIVVGVELAGGVTGYGETLPRQYVTGESDQSVIDVIRDELIPRLLEFRPQSFGEALEAIDSLPPVNRKGECATAARAALELALLDAYARWFDRGMDQVTGWLGLASFGEPGSIRTIRYSGVLAMREPDRIRRAARLLYWYGVRHFKFKVGFDDDPARTDAVMSVLGRSIHKGSATLRLDANAGWSIDEAKSQLDRWSSIPIQSIEQPLERHDDDQLPALAAHTDVPIMHDESLVTLDDAKRLIDLHVAGGFNIRISKCGGLMPALRIADLGRRHGVRLQIGCMVGETSILSAAGVQFLRLTPGVTQAEGCFGSFLLDEDICRRGLRFRYGGKPPRLAGAGMGVDVDAQRLEQLCERRRIAVDL